MNSSQIEDPVTESEITRLRIALIVLTIVQIGFLIITFADFKAYIKLYYETHSNWILTAMHISTMAVFLWYNWKRLPLEKKKRTDNTWMILFLGIIGMWLWIPNKKEIEKMNKKLHTTTAINNAN